MGESWGHRVRILSQEDCEHLLRVGLRCRSGRCTNEVTHATSYNYVTGRLGRVSWAERSVCREHAARFAAKHQVEITQAEAPQHALERVLQDGDASLLVPPPRGDGVAG